MATVKLHVPAFDIEIYVDAENENEVFENAEWDTLGERALDLAKIVSAEYDVPETETETEEEEEEEEEEESKP